VRWIRVRPSSAAESPGLPMDLFMLASPGDR